MDSLEGVIRFLGSPGIVSSSTPSSGTSLTVFLVFCLFLLLLNILVSLFYVARLGGDL